MKTNKVKVALVLLITLIMLMMAGCGILEELVGQDPVAAGLTQLLNTFTQEESEASQVVANAPADERTQTVELIFANAEGTKLVQESREIPYTLSLGRETLRQWLLGPAENGSLKRTVNASTALKDINIKDGVATVDLSRGFLELNGSINAQLALYSLVNTMCQFSTVNQVVLLIDGKPLDSYHGISTAKLQWKDGLIDLTVSGGGAATDEGFSVDNDLDTGSNTQPDTSLSPSNINIFQ